MGKLWTALALLIVAYWSCGCRATLQADPSEPAAESGYPTAEFRAGGRLFHGLGEVLLVRGRPLSEVRLEVQGYHDGTIRVDSSACNVSQSWSYTNSERKLVVIPGVATESCLVDIVVAPSFGADANGIRVYELKGQLLIKVLDEGMPWVGISSKVHASGDQRIWIPVEPPAPTSLVRLLFRGCDSSYDRFGRLVNGALTVLATDLGVPVTESRCLLEGAAKQGDYVKRVSWRIWGYRAGFTPLPLPDISSCFGRLCVTADTTVSLLALDSDYVFKPEARFRFDAARAHVLRAMTVKGRSFVCEYEPAVKEWRCLN